MRTGPKQELMKIAYDIALKNEMVYRTESQQVLVAVQDALAIRNDELVKAVMALSGGVASSHKGHCGAISAGIIAINSLYGRERKDFDKPVNYRPHVLSKRLVDRFEEHYGSILCTDIQKRLYGRTFDLIRGKGYLLNREEYKAFDQAGGHSEAGCAGLAANTAMWTVQIILEDIEANNGKNIFISRIDVEC